MQLHITGLYCFCVKKERKLSLFVALMELPLLPTAPQPLKIKGKMKRAKK